MTADGEIESLERFIRWRLGKLDGEPYLLPDNARKLLEEVAYRWRDVTTGAVTVVELVAASRWLDRPPELGDDAWREIITRLIGGSGILVAEDGDFRCVRQIVQEYLAACYIVGRYPRGPRWWQPPTWKYRNYLAPQRSWPDAWVRLFLAALWCPEAKRAVDRQLRRLLRDRHREPDINLIIEMGLRDPTPGSYIRNRIVNVLCSDLKDGQPDKVRWVATAKRLYRLDPTRTIAELENLIHHPGPTITPLRRLDAVNELAEHDPAGFPKNLKFLAYTLTMTGTREDWLNVATRIKDPELRKETLRQLVKNPKMGDLRANAAIPVFSPEELRELIDDSTLSDEERLELLKRLCELNRPMAVATMERIVWTVRKDDTRLTIIKRIQPHDRLVALRIARAVAFPENQKVDGRVRLDAGIVIGEIDPAQKIPTLVHLGNNSDLELTYCEEAAELVGKLEPVTGAQMYICLAKSCTPDESRLTLRLLKKAYALDHGPAAEALAKVAKDKHRPGRIRLDAVKIARPELGTERTIELYAIIAKTTDSDTVRAAVREVVNLTATREAGPHGTRALMDLARPVQPITVHLEAAKALWAMGRKKELQELVKTRNIGIDAALTLPETLVVEALITITKDRHEKETISCDAGIKAAKKNEKEGQQALRNLATRVISSEIRKRIDGYLNK